MSYIDELRQQTIDRIKRLGLDSAYIKRSLFTLFDDMETYYKKEVNQAKKWRQHELDRWNTVPEVYAGTVWRYINSKSETAWYGSVGEDLFDGTVDFGLWNINKNQFDFYMTVTESGKIVCSNGSKIAYQLLSVFSRRLHESSGDNTIKRAILVLETMGFKELDEIC